MDAKLIIAKYEPDHSGGVFLHCRREGVHERVSDFPVHFGKWGIYRGAHSGLGRLTQDELKWLRDQAITYLTRT